MITPSAQGMMDTKWEEARTRLVRFNSLGWMSIGGDKGFGAILRHHSQEVMEYSEWAKLNGRPPQERIEPDFHGF